MVPLSALADIIGEENLYFFAYDIFGKADENARLLREFISTVKAQRQCDKVDLIPVSMGATVAQMYFELYGGDRDVKRVISRAARASSAQPHRAPKKSRSRGAAASSLYPTGLSS